MLHPPTSLSAQVIKVLLRVFFRSSLLELHNEFLTPNIIKLVCAPSIEPYLRHPHLFFEYDSEI